MTSRQLILFGVEPRLLAPDDDASGGTGDRPADTAGLPGPDNGQIDLFAPPAVLSRELDVALAAGRFELAARLRFVLEQTYGPSLTHGLEFLDRLGNLRWEGTPGELLSTWAEIDGELAPRAHLRGRLRVGVFARLLALHTPEALVEARPDCLPALAAVLASGREASPEAGRRRARGLVRDALLAGRELVSLDFSEDEPLADLLAEDFPPRWLACLGLIRRLWSAAPRDEGDLGGFRNMPAEARSREEAALEFWRRLRIAENADTPERLLHEARRRMKQLSPELHALYMRRANGSRGP